MAHHVEFPLNTASVPLAREFVRTNLESFLGDHEVAALLTTELATNAVLHAHSPFGVSVLVVQAQVRVEVTDASRVIPTASPPPQIDSVSGRGLFLVSTLASRWGAQPLPAGKCMWFELDAPLDAQVRGRSSGEERHHPSPGVGGVGSPVAGP